MDGKMIGQDVEYDLKQIKRATLERGWTPYRLATEAGVSTATTARLFRGIRLTATTVKKLADALGISLKDLIVVSSDEESAA